MLRLQSMQASFYSVLYDKIPEYHVLKKITTVIEFSFINDFLKGSCLELLGRPPEEPGLFSTPKVLKHLK